MQLHQIACQDWTSPSNTLEGQVYRSLAIEATNRRVTAAISGNEVTGLLVDGENLVKVREKEHRENRTSWGGELGQEEMVRRFLELLCSSTV